MSRWKNTIFTTVGVVWALVGAKASDWPMWGFDAARSAASPVVEELPDSLHLHWVRELPAPRRAWPKQWDDGDKLEFDLSYAPVAKDGRLFVASMVTDTVTAYDTATGEELWRFYAEGPLRVAPAAWGEWVYAASDDGRLYALEAATGEKRWSFNGAPTDHRVLGNERIIGMWPARGGPAVLDGTVYFASGIWPFLGTFIYALDAETGSLIWSNTGHSTEWQLQPHGGAYAFSGVAPQGYIAVDGDRLVVAGGRASPALFNRRDGSLIHSRIQYHKGSGGYRVRIRDGHYYNHGSRFRLSDGGRYSRDDYDDPVWLALRDRAERLSDRLDGAVFEVMAADGRIFITTDTGRIYAFGADPGSEPRRYALDASPRSPEDTEVGRHVEDILEVAEARDGYALVLGAGDGEWLEQLAARSRFHIVAMDPDRARVDRVRRRLDRSGLYGTRIALLHGDFSETHTPAHSWSLVVVADPEAVGVELTPSWLDRVYERLRPYDGKAYLGFHPEEESVREAFSGFRPENGQVYRSVQHGACLVAREGPLPGVGQWTHQYGDSTQAVMSWDHRVRPPFGPIWFGGPSHDHVLPRHTAGPRPHVSHGRLVILGVETVSARCVFTGRELWVREFPGIGHPFTNLSLEERWEQGESVYMTNQPGATYIGSPYVTLPDAVYLRYRNQVIRLDPETGETVDGWRLPSAQTEGSEDDVDWGHISSQGDYVITTTDPHIFGDGDLGSWGDDSWDATSSKRLVVLDRHSGRVAWRRDARVGFRHNAIASADGRLFINDLLTEQAQELAQRRGLEIEEPARLQALDIRTGDVLWTVDSEVFGTFLSYSAEHDILIEGGTTDGRRRLRGEPTSQMIARRGRDGEKLWSRTGSYNGPVILHGDTIIPARPGSAICLLTGEDKHRTHPITGEEMVWAYWRTYGCGTANASSHLLLFRSGAAGFTDLDDGGTGTLGGFRAGCTANMIAADGILNAPDYTRTCTCSYQNQTSLGLVHMPEMEMWTFDRPLGRVEGAVERLGLNLGAPGDRRADNGTLWVHVPHRAPSAESEVLFLDVGAELDVPVRMVSALGDSALDSYPKHTLDGDMSTAWSVSCGRRGRFRQSLTYEIDKPVLLDRIRVAWTGPEGTQYRVETSLDGEEWETVFQGQGEGPGRDVETISFDPVRTRFVRWYLGDHADTSEDSRGRRRLRHAHVYQVRLGDLPFPEAYAYFTPKSFFRIQSLFVDGRRGVNWVASSGVDNVKEVRLRNLNGNGARYRLTLHFMEPDAAVTPGRRRFSVLADGRRLVSDFDIAREAGGSHRAVTLTADGIPIENELRLAFLPVPGSEYPPVLSGVELIRE